MPIKSLQNIIYTLFEQAKLDDPAHGQLYDQAYKEISNILSAAEWGERERRRL